MEQDEIVQYIYQLIAKACCHSRGSIERNKKLTEIMSLMQSSGKILRNSQLNQFDYEDVLNSTWLYFCRNLCEANTASSCFYCSVISCFLSFPQPKIDSISTNFKDFAGLRFFHPSIYCLYYFFPQIIAVRTWHFLSS